MLPANVGTGIVHWQAGVAIIDGDDADQNPDMIYPSGTVTFTPSITHVQNVNAIPNPITISLAPIVGVLDEEGYLCTPVSATDRTPMYRGVRLVATDDLDLSVTNWNYSVAYRLGVVNGATPTIPAHPLAVPEGADIDLSLFAPVPSSPPVGTPQYVAAVLRAEAAATEAKSAAADMTTAMGSKADTVHGHEIADVAGLQAVLDAASGGGGSPAWESVTGKPATFAPSAHGHAASEVTGLADVATSGAYADLTGAPSIPSAPGDVGAQPAGDYVGITDPRLSDARTPTAHTHTLANVTGLQGALDGKQPSGSYATSTDMTTALLGKADTVHAHTTTDISGLGIQIAGILNEGEPYPSEGIWIVRPAP